jgi:hypothetical protein
MVLFYYCIYIDLPADFTTLDRFMFHPNDVLGRV